MQWATLILDVTTAVVGEHIVVNLPVAPGDDSLSRVVVDVAIANNIVCAGWPKPGSSTLVRLAPITEIPSAVHVPRMVKASRGMLPRHKPTDHVGIKRHA